MTCGCANSTSTSTSNSAPYYGGGGKRQKSKSKKKTKKNGKKRRKSTRKICGGNYLTGTIADGPDGPAIYKMTGAQFAGSHFAVDSDVTKQKLKF